MRQPRAQQLVDTGIHLSGPRAPAGCRALSNNGTASGDRGLKTAGLPPLAVRIWVPYPQPVGQGLLKQRDRPARVPRVPEGAGEVVARDQGVRMAGAAGEQGGDA